MSTNTKRSPNWLYENMKATAEQVDRWSPFLKMCFNVPGWEKHYKDNVIPLNPKADEHGVFDFDNKNRSTFVD